MNACIVKENELSGCLMVWEILTFAIVAEVKLHPRSFRLPFTTLQK
ncbi:hypothetical protein [Alysiella crassa]|nr:hypothetical protein [Alysiella crassa]UOP07693.1 hypothetical protein LVJ80_04860 [Alysiella crassa]